MTHGRFSRFVLPFIGLVVPYATGCDGAAICEEFSILCQDGGGGDGGDGGNGSGGQGEGGSIVPAGCDPRIEAEIGDECGIFVDSTAPGDEAGTKAAPYRSLALALTKVGPEQAVYVCGSPVEEAISISTTTVLFGGLDCGSWAPTENKTPWTAEPNQIPLRIGDSADGSLLHNFVITAADADGFDSVSLQGNSSIAAWIASDATLENVDLIAGVGAAGGDGADQKGQAKGRLDFPDDFNGNEGGGCGMPAGDATQPQCDSGVTRGGAGGDGLMDSGVGGQIGTVSPSLGEPDGTAGLGDTGVSGWSCSQGGTGQEGHDGPEGKPGDGGATIGTLNAMPYQGAGGEPGGMGKSGQGGGGGGGRKGNNANGCSAGSAGPSGGGGGAGGCGGIAGGGGGAGGASIALVSLSSTLTLTNVTLTAKGGGTGGIGGDGQDGGVGGLAGPGGGAACSGGAGGQGGSGGPGGGGRGGPSLGIAFTGAEPVIDVEDIIFSVEAASGGNGGNGNAEVNAGSPGLNQATQKFD